MGAPVKFERVAAPVDQMDLGLEVLRSIAIALGNPESGEPDALSSIRITLEHAIRLLEPVHERLNEQHR